MSVNKTVAATVALTLLAGCKGNIQTCNDSAAKKSVIQIISENSHAQAQKPSQDELKRIDAGAALTDIKTTDSDDKLGSYECSANYSVTYNDKQYSLPVTYKLSHVEDKNTTDAQVHLGQVPTLYFKLAAEILKKKAEEFNNSIGDYVKKRGSGFAYATAPCLITKIANYKQEHGDSFTLNNIPELEKTCNAEADEYRKLVSDYVTKSGGDNKTQRISCIIYMSAQAIGLAMDEGASDGLSVYTKLGAPSFIADTDQQCTSIHEIATYAFPAYAGITAHLPSDGNLYYESAPSSQAQSQNVPPQATVATPESTLPKLSAAAEKAISEGFVEIKDPKVKACTDASIAAINKKNGESSPINFEMYNEAAVKCGFNI